MTKLSPTAQKVFNAFNTKFDWIEDGVPGPQFKAIAAVIRTVTFELSFGHGTGSGIVDEEDLLAIAIEFEKATVKTNA